MPRPLLLALLLFTAGCAQEKIMLEVTSAPQGATLEYQVVAEGTPPTPMTGWIHLGLTPFHAEQPMHPLWRDPKANLVLKLQKPGFKPAARQYQPARILTDNHHLRDHFVLETDRPGP